MTSILVEASGRATVARPLAEVWAAVDTVPAMATLIEIIEACDQIDGGWRWDLGQRGAMGLNVQVTFDVATKHVPETEIVFEPIGDAARWASGQSRISLSHDGGVTSIEVVVPLLLELPLPRLLAAPVSRIIRRDVQAIVDDFLHCWATA